MYAEGNKKTIVSDNIKGISGAKWWKWVFPGLLSVILFLVMSKDSQYFNQLLLYDDEFGYWAASAYLTGTDWRSVTSGIPYYSYGYGFLILTPIRLLFSSPDMMYFAALIVNSLLIVGSFWIARYVTGKLFEEMHWAAIDTICFLVMLYPSNIVFAHIAWAECLLVFMFWVFVWTSLRVITKPSVLNHIGIAAVAMGLYVVHQRSIAVAIATWMVMVWCFFADKGRRKKVAVFAVVFVALAVAHMFIKTDLVDTYYFNNIRVDVNNMGGQVEKITDIFSLDGFWELLQSIIGKWFYLFVATLMAAWWGAEFLFRKMGPYLKESFSQIKQHKKEGLVENLSLWFTWLLLAFGGNFMVCAIYMKFGMRNDTLVYGRYNEYMIGIYFIIGVIAFLKDEKWLFKTMVYFTVALLCGWFVQSILDGLNLTAYQAYHSICTSLFLEKGSSVKGGIMAYTMMGLAVSTFAMLLVKAKPWRQFDWVRIGIALCPVIILFHVTAYTMISGTMMEKQNLRIINITYLVDKINQIDPEASKRVYYCSDTESRYWSESFQFHLKDTPLTVTTSSEIDPDSDDFYIVGNDFVHTVGFDEEFYCIKESYQFAVIVNADGELAQKAKELGE
ncbi:MAG: hypothetical protein K2O32_00470 [Acetatifactor sp.]|nr:hypothetical protein [Acetatifactor sp.]